MKPVIGVSPYLLSYNSSTPQNCTEICTTQPVGGNCLNCHNTFFYLSHTQTQSHFLSLTFVFISLSPSHSSLPLVSYTVQIISISNLNVSLSQLNHLVTSGEVIASPRFLNLSDSCELGDMPRLSHYCQEERFRTLRNSPRNNPLLSDTIRDRINRPLSNYYSGTVVNTNALNWLNAAITSSHQRESIETTLLETYSCTS